MIVYEQHPALFSYLNSVLQVKLTPDMAKVIASVSEDRIMGVVAFSRFTPHNCEMSVASTTPKFLTRGFIKAIFGYPFKQLGLNRVSAVVDVNNLKSQRLNERLGFVNEAVLKGWFGESDAILYRMLEGECKWL